MICHELPGLTTETDPARHLDALPRRQQPGDSEQSILLRRRLFFRLRNREIVPDQQGKLRTIGCIEYPPKKLTDGTDSAPFECWSAYPGRPPNWLHHRGITRNRLASIDRLFPPRWPGDIPAAPRARISEWLTALVKGRNADEAVKSSMAAIHAAAAIPGEIRLKEQLGEIVLTANGAWRSPDPERLFLPVDSENDGRIREPASTVHPELASDRETLSALINLGLKAPSPESRLRFVTEYILQRSNNEEPSADVLRHFGSLHARYLPRQSFPSSENTKVGNSENSGPRNFECVHGKVLGAVLIPYCCQERSCPAMRAGMTASR